MGAATKGLSLCFRRIYKLERGARRLAIRARRSLPMTIAVLYFAALRELLGKSEETLSDVPLPLPVHAFAARLGQRHPQLVPHLGSVRFAVNEAFVGANAEIRDGDTVALIPPVSGG
jgi:molybdopterin synthase sulfur carrier subunit